MALLLKIAELKRGGSSLAEIKRAMENDVAKVRDNGDDLAAKESDRVRGDIIRVATEQFVTKGYKGTRVMEIIQELGLNPHIFYRHFPSKLDLLVECFKTATPPPGPRVSADNVPVDLGEHVLRGLVLQSDWGTLSAMLSVAIRSEDHEASTAEHFAQAWDSIMRNVVRDFESVRPSGAGEPPISDELLAYSLLGAYRFARSRTTWDEKYESADLLRAHLFVFLALIAAISGEVDIYSKVARYEKAIQELVAGARTLPVPLEI